MNVLAIGAHPDDIEMGCFATLAKHYFDGDKIFGVMMTNGELGGDVRVRRMEQEESAKEIDMKLYFGNFPDGDVRENAAIITFLDNIIKKNEIDVVYTHSEKDRHQDHRAIARASISASRTVKELYSYEDLSLVSSFNPQLFVDVTDTFHVKKDALKKYESQIDRTFIDGLEGIAKFRASQCRLSGRLCEAFEIQRVFKNGGSPYLRERLNLKVQNQQLQNSSSGQMGENEVYLDQLGGAKAQPLQIPSINNQFITTTRKNFSKSSMDQKDHKPRNSSKKIKNHKDELAEIKNAIAMYKWELTLLKEEFGAYKKNLDQFNLIKNP